MYKDSPSGEAYRLAQIFEGGNIDKFSNSSKVYHPKNFPMQHLYVKLINVNHGASITL